MTFVPTVTERANPTTCHVCGRHATGIGIGNPSKGDPRFLCTECLLILECIKDVRRFDPYEMKARVGGMDAAAPLVDAYGPDLGEWTEDQVLEFCGAVWQGCADRLRTLIKNGEAPF